MNNLEYLKKVSKDDGLSEIETSKYEFRMTKALEILTEEFINTKTEIIDELKSIKIELSVIGRIVEESK